ncbi:MAG: DUF5719 family protein [Nocardioides sp.]
MRDADVVRRRRTPRLDLVTVLAVVVPLVTVGVLAGVRRPPVHETDEPPALTSLTDASVVCPGPVSTAPDAWASTASGQQGAVTVTAGGQSSKVSVTPGASAPLTGSSALVVRGTDALAPGLLGLRAGTAPLTTQACSVPSSEQWFTGIGSGPDHDSVIELVNPDSGRADVDITLYGRHAFSVRKLHGITIPAHRTVSLDLGAIVPRRMLLSAQVQISRGRLAVHVLDSRTDLATHQTISEWLPRQDAPALQNVLLGLPAGPGQRTLQIANPSEDQVRAQVKIVTADTTFAPAGLETLSVPPGSTLSVSMTKVLGKALSDGALGIEVVADAPVTASVATQLDGDEALTVPDPVVRHEAATLLPVAPTAPAKPGGKKPTPVTATLHLTAASAGAAQVTAYDATGKQLLDQRVGTELGKVVKVLLPAGSAYLKVVPQGTELRGSVVLTGAGASVVPLGELLTQGLVPQIRPGLS